jgi:cobalt-precorrin 5A hydrolase / cobalt-factor III methyltransferase / precorrin-3B C17-methyltransferase
MVKPAIVILGASALPLAQKLKAELGGEIHGPHCVSGSDTPYGKATLHLQELFKAGRPIIGLCASGILIRALAPMLADKRNEPPIVAVAEDGSTAVPLLGGHHGANELARRIAALCDGHAAITTASEIVFGLALDDPLPGFVLANPQDSKEAAAAILAGAKIAYLRQPGESREALIPFNVTDATQFSAENWTPDFSGVTIEVTERAVAGNNRKLVYHPQVLAVGVGCERGTDPAELQTLIAETLADNGLAPHAVACHASIDVKEDEPAIFTLDNVRFFTADQLNALSPRLKSPSDIVAREVGTPGVAEAAALAAARPGAELIVAKTKSRRATCAIARAGAPIVEFKGRPRGWLQVVGMGPGSAEWRSPAASAALETASDWVGYGLYLDLIADLNAGQAEHRFPLGGEEDRARRAIALAMEGKHVALVCSGDAGIYAMASLVYEIVDREPCRIAIEVIPGVSAFQAAAAKAGAMIGHDFCCISLSDLLTPWEVIEKRVRAAAEADFVTAFYNPRSAKRRDQLQRALAILSRHRPADTPVVTATNLSRPGETVRIVPFAQFDADEVDMLTLVMVGSSQSKTFKRGDGRTYAYTPRGYAQKREQP